MINDVDWRAPGGIYVRLREWAREVPGVVINNLGRELSMGILHWYPAALWARNVPLTLRGGRRAGASPGGGAGLARKHWVMTALRLRQLTYQIAGLRPDGNAYDAG